LLILPSSRGTLQAKKKKRKKKEEYIE